MAVTYPFPQATKRRGPRISLVTVIAILFALVMVWQIVAAIDNADERMEALSIQPGDQVEYDFIARLPDGRVHSTTIRSVAEQANQSQGLPLQPSFTYVAQRARIDPAEPGLPWGSAADAAVEASFVGGTVHITVPPEEGTGVWEPFRGGQPIPRELLGQQFSRVVFLQEPAAAQAEGNTGTSEFDLEAINNAIGPLEAGETYNAGRDFPPSWDLLIEDINFDNRSLTFRHTVQNGQTFDLDQLPGTATVLLQAGETRLVYRLNLEQGGRFAVQANDNLYNLGFRAGSYRVASVNATDIQLDYNSGPDPAVVGLPLEVEIKIRNKLTGTS